MTVLRRDIIRIRSNSGPPPPPAVSHCLYWMGSHEPIHHVEIVAVLLDDDIAALLAIKKPVADWLFACRVTLANRQPAAYPRRADGYDSAQLARFHDLITLPVIRAVALLKVHRDPPTLIRCLSPTSPPPPP